MGNTCYLNAVTQCIFHCRPFRGDLRRQAPGSLLECVVQSSLLGTAGNIGASRLMCGRARGSSLGSADSSRSNLRCLPQLLRESRYLITRECSQCCQVCRGFSLRPPTRTRRIRGFQNQGVLREICRRTANNIEACRLLECVVQGSLLGTAGNIGASRLLCGRARGSSLGTADSSRSNRRCLPQLLEESRYLIPRDCSQCCQVCRRFSLRPPRRTPEAASAKLHPRTPASFVRFNISQKRNISQLWCH